MTMETVELKLMKRAVLVRSLKADMKRSIDTIHTLMTKDELSVAILEITQALEMIPAGDEVVG